MFGIVLDVLYFCSELVDLFLGGIGIMVGVRLKCTCLKGCPVGFCGEASLVSP